MPDLTPEEYAAAQAAADAAGDLTPEQQAEADTNDALASHYQRMCAPATAKNPGPREMVRGFPAFCYGVCCT